MYTKRKAPTRRTLCNVTGPRGGNTTIEVLNYIGGKIDEQAYFAGHIVLGIGMKEFLPGNLFLFVKSRGERRRVRRCLDSLGLHKVAAETLELSQAQHQHENRRTCTSKSR